MNREGVPYRQIQFLRLDTERVALNPVEQKVQLEHAVGVTKAFAGTVLSSFGVTGMAIETVHVYQESTPNLRLCALFIGATVLGIKTIEGALNSIKSGRKRADELGLPKKRHLELVK